MTLVSIFIIYNACTSNKITTIIPPAFGFPEPARENTTA